MGDQERTNWSDGFPVQMGEYTLGTAEASPETNGYWEGVDRDELSLKHCAACGRYLHPRRMVCSACASTELEWKAVSGSGQVYTFSQLYRAPRPELVASVPYFLGIVRLEEGVHLFSRLLPENGTDITIGAPVQVAFQRMEIGGKLPVFVVKRS